MSALLWLALGLVLGVFLPDRIHLAVKAWVRGAWGWAWGRVGTRAPAPAMAVASAPTVSVAKAAFNLAGAFGAAVGFVMRRPLLCLGLALLLFWLLAGRSCSPFGLEFGKSRGELRLEREIAETNARVAEHEARLAEVSRDLAVNTERDRGRRAVVIAEAEQELDDAAAQLDPQTLHSVYSTRYLCVLDPSACPDSPNPPASGPPRVRGAGADAA